MGTEAAVGRLPPGNDLLPLPPSGTGTQLLATASVSEGQRPAPERGGTASSPPAPMGDAAGAQLTRLQGLLATAAPGWTPGKTPRVGWLHLSGHSPTQRPRRGFQGATLFCMTRNSLSQPDRRFRQRGPPPPSVNPAAASHGCWGRWGHPGGRSSPSRETSGRERPRPACRSPPTQALFSGGCPASSASDERLQVPPDDWQGLNPEDPLAPLPFPCRNPPCRVLPAPQRPPVTRDVEREIFISR